MRVVARGPWPARIMLVGEAPGAEEERAGRPFVGASGQELSRMLAEAGINEEDVYFTNVVDVRPPHNDLSQWFYSKSEAKAEPYAALINGKIVNQTIADGVARLEEEIKRVQPYVIIAAGDTALWALTGNTGITKWRGSLLEYSGNGQLIKVIPVLHPAYVLRQWGSRPLVIHDLKRAAREASSRERVLPIFFNVVRPSYSKAIERLDEMLLQADRAEVLRISVDLETRSGHIACIGLATNASSAICIPFMCVENAEGYWSAAEEANIVQRLQRLLDHPHVELVGQNFLYDLQYMNYYWGVQGQRTRIDTMIWHHTIWPSMQKSLDFLSSLYCANHVYWKDDGKLWDSSVPEDQLWHYNCVDACRTFEIASALEQLADQVNLREQCEEQMRFFFRALEVMLRGVKVDIKLKNELYDELIYAASQYEAWLENIIPEQIHPRKKNTSPWYRSPKQLQDLFYSTFGIKPVLSRKTQRPTTDDKALATIGKREPLLAPITDAISRYRSLTVISNAINAPVDPDKRMRCSYNVAGTITFRLSSSENAFGRGTNLQNLTTGEEEAPNIGPYKIKLPNIRRYYIPDSGYVICDVDLERADAQVVAWEADDTELMDIFSSGADVHTENAKAIYGERATPNHRRLAKAGVHATNYHVFPRTLASTLGITIKEAEDFQARWFGAHPKIKEWHKRIEHELQTTKTVSNKFGYRITFFDRMDVPMLQQALAWIPQSTVALVINKAWDNIADLEYLEVLLQVHDSLVFQIRRSYLHKLPEVRNLMRIPVPYPRPLIIDLGLKVSEKSWGDCKSVPWDYAQ